MPFSEYYTGEGIRSTHKYARRSQEYIKSLYKKAAKEGWQCEDAIREMDKVLQMYNEGLKYSEYSRKFKSIDNTPAEVHSLDSKDNIIKVSELDTLYLFGLRKQLQFTHNQVITEIAGETYNYLVEDIEILANYYNQKVMVVIDYNNKEVCHLTSSLYFS